MDKPMPTHLQALTYLGTFIGRPAPRNDAIMEACGLLTSSAGSIFTRLVKGGYLIIERRGGSRRFVFSDGSATGWGDNLSGRRPASWKAPVRGLAHRYTNASAKCAIEQYWAERGKEVRVVISGKGVISTFNADGTPFKQAVDNGDNVSRGTAVSDA